MKKIKILLLSAAVLFAVQSFAQDTKGKVEKALKKAGDKTAEVAVKGASAINDRIYKDKVAPGGETVYIDRHSKYYYVNTKGGKVYVSKSKLIDKPAQ